MDPWPVTWPNLSDLMGWGQQISSTSWQNTDLAIVSWCSDDGVRDITDLARVSWCLDEGVRDITNFTRVYSRYTKIIHVLCMSLPLSCGNTRQIFNVIWKRQIIFHDDVIKWKHFPRYWPFVREIHRPPCMDGLVQTLAVLQNKLNIMQKLNLFTSHVKLNRTR